MHICVSLNPFRALFPEERVSWGGSCHQGETDDSTRKSSLAQVVDAGSGLFRVSSVRLLSLGAGAWLKESLGQSLIFPTLFLGLLCWNFIHNNDGIC